MVDMETIRSAHLVIHAKRQRAMQHEQRWPKTRGYSYPFCRPCQRVRAACPQEQGRLGWALSLAPKCSPPAGVCVDYKGIITQSQNCSCKALYCSSQLLLVSIMLEHAGWLAFVVRCHPDP